MQALLIAIVTWLSANYGLPSNYDLPTIQFAEPMEIAFVRYGAFSPEQRSKVAAAQSALPAEARGSVVSVYRDNDRTIMLPQGWRGVTPAEQSIVVHEMVHHLQNVGQLHFICPQEREAMAYQAQEKWLQQFGKSLASEFKLDAFTVMVNSHCLR